MRKFLVTIETKGSTQARRERGYKTRYTVDSESAMAAIIHVRECLGNCYRKIITATEVGSVEGL